MNVIKRLKAPTPAKYKKLGKLMKDISLSLGAGLVAATAFSLPTLLISIVGLITFVTSSISTYCYAQIEPEEVK